MSEDYATTYNIAYLGANPDQAFKF